MLKKLVIAAIVVYTICMVGALIAPPPRTPLRPIAIPDIPSDEITDPPIIIQPLQVGFTINFHHPANLQVYLDAVDELAAMGFNAIQINTPIYQENATAETITVLDTIEGEPAVGRSPTRDQLVALLDHCRAAKLRVTLMPILLMTNPQDGAWRGKIQPSYWSRWWAGYQRQIDYFVEIANETGVDTLCVGSELLSTESQTTRWIELIEHVRESFRGRVIYSTNWDSYQKPTFWHAVDAIGINGYWELTSDEYSNDPDAKPPDADQLAQRWASIRQRLEAFADAQQRPILLTEVGYPSLPWGLRDPWNYVADGQTQAVHATQLAGYNAFFTAWREPLGPNNDPTRFAGVFFYKWDPYHQGGDTDTGYGIRGKPTQQLLIDWLKTRKTAAAPPATPVTEPTTPTPPDSDNVQGNE